jgi:SAM-dependent methyltransferase
MSSSSPIIAFYQTQSYGFGALERNNRLLWAFREIAGMEPSSILDCGCGEGVLLAALKKRLTTAKCVGLEIDQKAIRAASEKGVEAVAHDLNTRPFPLPDGSFDVCFMGELIEHVFSPDDLLEEARRILKPNGKLLLTTPNLAAWFNRLLLGLGYQPIFSEVSCRANAGHLINLSGVPAGHIRVFTLPALREMLIRCGFTILRIDAIGMNADLHKHPWAVKAVNALFCHPSVSSGIAVVAQKP